jgi:hypothetical protein
MVTDVKSCLGSIIFMWAGCQFSSCYVQTDMENLKHKFPLILAANTARNGHGAVTCQEIWTK